MCVNGNVTPLIANERLGRLPDQLAIPLSWLFLNRKVLEIVKAAIWKARLWSIVHERVVYVRRLVLWRRESSLGTDTRELYR